MRKVLSLMILILILLESTLAFAAPTTKLAVVSLFSQKKINESVYGKIYSRSELSTYSVVYLTPYTFNKKAYYLARDLAKAFSMDSKWFSKEGILALNGNNMLLAVAPRKKSMLITKHNRLYNVPLQAFDKNGALYLPGTILKELNFKSNKDSTIFHVYPSVLKHVYEKKLDEFVKKNSIFLTTKPKVMSQYTTYFNPGTKNRTANIYHASDYIDGLIIPPGQVFSFNKTLGPRSEATGYKKAIIFFKKEKTEDYGGGICQVSSTIFNAVYRSKLKVLQRKSHSLDITYVPKGMDATVSYGYIDFVFKNNRPYPILLNTNPHGSHLSAKLSRWF